MADQHIKPLEKLKNIAETLGVPHDIDKYIGPADTFAAYSMSEISGTEFADNRAQEHIASVRFDYTQPYNLSYQDKIFEIIDLLIDAGFEEPQVVVVTNEDYKYRILQFSTEISI